MNYAIRKMLALGGTRPLCLSMTFLSSLVIPALLYGQSPTDIAVSNTAIQSPVKRFGINLGTLTNYDSGQITKNLLVGNPGFEGQIWNSTIRCHSGTGNSCTDDDIYSGWPANFWAGARYEVFYGTSAGRTGTIVSSTTGGAGLGVVFTFDTTGVAPAYGDYMIVRMSIPGGAIGGWQASSFGAGVVGDNLTDLPPGTLGKQTAIVTAPGASDSAKIQTSFDSTNTRSFVQLNGTYQLQFKAKGVAGSSQVLVQLNRGGTISYLNDTINLSNNWTTYNVPFNATENGTAIGTVTLSFSTVYGADSFELDDVSLTQTNGDASNPTAFTDPLIRALQTAQPGIIRYWGNNGQLGETLDNMLAPQFGRQRAGYSAFSNEATLIDYGLHDFLVLCQTLGAEPWIVVPTTFSTTDAANLMEYLAGQSTTGYGAKRIALGQAAPWTQVFSKIHLEFGNEAWNSTFQGGSILYNQPYGSRAQTIFAAMQSNASYTAGVTGLFDFVLGGQAGSPGYNLGVQDYCNNNTSFTVAPYTMNTVDNYSDNETLFGSTFAEPEAFMSSSPTTSAEGATPGLVYENYFDIQQSTHPVPLSFYEVNMSTLLGSIPQATLDSYVSSTGAGLMVADTMLQGLKQYGVVNQNLFALPQYNFTRTDGSQVYLWGAVVDMGVTDRKRPQYLALELMNQALSAGGSMLKTIHTGADPTWNVATVTNTIQYTGAHNLQSYAFQQGNSLSLIVFNLSRTATLPVTFSGLNAPAGTVQMQQLTSPNITDTNEISELVKITPSVLSNFVGATGLSLPPFSMTLLNWSKSTGAPVISNVSAGAISTTSATVSWTTDQPATSQVQYGTTASYGNSSPVNSTLSLRHSATLSGLTPSTTYNISAVSANSSGSSGASPNFTFKTAVPAPVISAVNVNVLSTTSVTITWITDQPSTSIVSYGTSSVYSFSSVNSTLTSSHSVTLTGLSVSTSYAYQISSANASGLPAYSGNLVFSTLSAPVISQVAVSNVTSTSATISWTTDQATTSQMVYGATTGYGSSTPLNSALVTSHTITLTGLTPNVKYNFQVLSVNSYGLSANSANSSFTTTLVGPIITYVFSSAISNTSATINWTTDSPSTGQVRFGTTTSYGATSALNSSLTTSHTVTLTSLTLGTTYNYSVLSANSAGVSTASGNFTFTTSGGSTTTNIAVGATVLQPNVKRFGINLGSINNYDSGQMMKNLVSANPGFEGQIWNSAIACGSATANSCTDSNGYSTWGANFWANATYQVISGPAAGRTGTVGSSTAAASGTGATLTLNDSGIAPGAGAYVLLRKSVSGGSASGWQPNVSASGTVTDNLADLPPSTSGKQTVELSAPTASDYAGITTFIDNSLGKSFLQLNGAYQLQFKAKALGGSNQISVALKRGSTTFLNEIVVLSNSWNTYNLPFNAAESGALGGISLSITTVYGQDYILLDDVSLTQTDSDASNVTSFRDSVVNALRTAQPGILRYWGGNGQMGETLDNLLAPQFGRQRAGYSEFSSTSNQIDYGLHEFLILCQAIGAEPWFVVPSTFTYADSANLIEYLAGSTATTYGAKRAALGQATPWTQVFSKIHLEFGEQAWNPNMAGASILDMATYGAQAQVAFGAMKSSTSYAASAASFDFVLGGPASSPANIALIQNNCNNNTSFDVEPYTMNAIDSYSTNESLFGPTFAEPEALMSSLGTSEGTNPGMIFQDYHSLQSTTNPVPLSFSEINLSTLGGSITQTALNSYVTSLGAGLMVADTMMQGLQQFGVVNQNLYSLSQYQSQRADGSIVDLFGSVVDMGVTDLRRPQYLALELLNQALSNGASMLQTTHTGANPTWDQPLLNSVFLNGAHYLQSYAFQNGSNDSLVIFNLSRTSALPVTFSGTNAPTGSVQMQQLTSANLTNTNELSNLVQIATTAITNFNGSTGLSLPPYSMTVLNWSSSTQAPVISGVRASAVTTTSATVTWTTDEPSTSLIEYGVSASYGSSSVPNSVLTRNHSVVLTGLISGTTYNLAAVSANSAGASSTSSNSTFTTASPAPVISGVNVTYTSTTSANVNWTTDQASTSQVAFGTSTAYGSVALSSSLVTSHSVALTGLTPNSLYDFAVTSVNSAGLPATSANYSLTAGNPPAVSNIAVSGITGTAATITWTTDQPTTSLVNYGTTTAYGQASTVNPALVTVHSVTLSGLSVNTTYNFDVVSSNSVGNYTTSANSTFATAAVALPVISNVSVTAVSGSSATITWNTDQPTTSIVNYGTTPSYGSSTANSSLVTSHSVTLTGLLHTQAYFFDVVSANSAGFAATSTSSTFTTTTSSAPYVGYVAAWGINNTGATVTWSTDVPSNTQLAFGTTTALGQLSPIQATLVTSHGVTITGLLSGTTYYFVAQSTSSNGFTGSSSVLSFTTTGTQTPVGPVISQISVANITASSATITWTTDQPSTAQVNYGTTTSYGSTSTLNSTLQTTQSVTLTGLASGTAYNFDVASANAGGLSSTSANQTFTTSVVVGTPPLITNVTVTNITPTTATVTWTTDQPSTAKVNYGSTTSYGAASAVSTILNTSQSVTLTGLTPGITYDFDVVSGNAGGASTTSSNFVFTSSALAPTPTISNIAITGITNTGATITWTTDQATTSLVNYGTSSAYGSSSSPNSTSTTSHSVALTGLTLGTTYYFDVVSTNTSALTATSGNYNFVTSGASGAPVITSVLVSNITGTSATVTWTTDQASTSLVNYGTTTALGNATALSSTLQTAHSVNLSGLTAGTTYNFDVVSTNASSNSSTSSAFLFNTNGSAGSPVISNLSVINVTANSVTVLWNTDQATTSQLAYGTTTSYGSTSTQDSTLITTHSMSLTGLAAGTTYDLKAISLNSTGSSVGSANLSFTTPASGASSPFVGYIASWGINNTGAIVTWSTDVPANTRLAYGTTTALGQLTPADSTAVTSHGVTLAGLASGTTYYYVAESTAGNGATGYSSILSFTTTGVAVAAAPVISNVTTTNISGNSATITWTTSQPATAQVSYGTTTSYESSSSLNSTLQTTQSVTLTGLTAGTTYNYAIISANASGASTTSANFTLTTLQNAGNPPVITGIATSSMTNSSVTITWTTDLPSSTLVNYGTSTTYGSASTPNSSLVTAHSVTLTGLTASTLYDFTVSSTTGGGASATSLNNTVTTTSLAATPPFVGYVASWGINNTGATVSWSTDVPATTQLAYGTTSALGQTSPLQTATTTSHGVVLTGLNSGTTYYFVAQSTAASGATGYSTTFSFTTTGTPTSPPPAISAVAATSIASSSVTITWTTDQASTSLVNYGPTTNYGASSSLNSTLQTSHSVTLSGLTQSTLYNFQVVSANATSNSATSADYTFTTAVGVGAPVISAVAAGGMTNTAATITWTTDQPSSSQVAYGPTASYGSTSALASTLVSSHSVTLTGLTAGTTYNFQVISINSAGTQATSTNSSLTTTGTPAAPVISSVAATTISSSSATITWTTDQATSSLVNYGTTAAYGSASTIDNTRVTSHSITLTGLASNTTYNYQVVSSNSAGTQAISANFTFSTGTPTGPAATVSFVVAWGVTSTQATVTWSTDVPATTQLAFGTTTALGQLSPLQSTLATSHGVTLTGLAPGTTYYFVAQSVNATGVMGSSAASTFTTTGHSLPVISSIIVTPNANHTATISWTTSVPTNGYVQYGSAAGSYVGYSAQTVLTASPVCTFGYVPSGTVHFQLISTDAQGNQTVSPDATFIEP